MKLVKEPEHRFHEQTLRTWRDCDTWDEEAKTFAKDCYAKGRRHTDLHRQHVVCSMRVFLVKDSSNLSQYPRARGWRLWTATRRRMVTLWGTCTAMHALREL